MPIHDWFHWGCICRSFGCILLVFFFLLHSANLFVLTTITYLCIRQSHITFTAGGTDELLLAILLGTFVIYYWIGLYSPCLQVCNVCITLNARPHYLQAKISHVHIRLPQGFCNSTVKCPDYCTGLLSCLIVSLVLFGFLDKIPTCPWLFFNWRQTKYYQSMLTCCRQRFQLYPRVYNAGIR